MRMTSIRRLSARSSSVSLAAARSSGPKIPPLRRVTGSYSPNEVADMR